MIAADAFNEALRHHQQGRLAEAERLYRQVLERDPAHAPALHHLGLVAQATGRLQDACDLLREAARQNPDDGVYQNNLANVLRELGRLPEAVEAYRAAVRCDSNYINAHFNLAALLMDSNDLEGAVDAYKQVLRLAPDDTDAVGALGVAMMALGDTSEAIVCFRRVIALRPDDPVAYYNLATTLKDGGEHDAAIELYEKALELNPNYAEAHNNIGLLLKKKGEADRAMQAFSEAIRSNPRHIYALVHLSGLLREKGDLARAEEVGRTAIEIDARNPQALQNLGAVLLAMTRWGAAERVLRVALDVDPEFAEVRVALGEALLSQCRLGEAAMEYRAVQSHSVCYRLAQNDLAACLFFQGQTSAGLAAFSRALEADPGYVEGHSNFLFYSNYLEDLSPRESYDLHRKWQRQHATHVARPALEVDLTPSRRLQVGYVSPDFCTHSVANFLEPLIKDLNREHFTVTCYADVPLEDEVTHRFRVSADRWRDLRGLNHDEAAAVIRGDGIDILVDLAGHTGRNRLPVFARRAAPIQVSYLGYANTTGLDQMDYRLTDEIVDPPGEADQLHSEELVRLPGGFLCYAPLADGPPVSEAPVLGHGHVTFGSFNNACKVNATVVAAWARILTGMPGSKLLMKSTQLEDPGTQRHFHRLFADHGIGEDRVEMMGKLPDRDEHLGVYSRIDVALDPFPYNGTTTTCEALWMGVPVVTLCGRVHRARVSASILHHAGLDELVTPTIDAYVEKALALAREPRKLTSLRHALRERVAASALTDTARAVDALQSEFLEMWRRHRE